MTTNVSAAINELKKAHTIGREIIAKYGREKELGSQLIADLAERHGVKFNRIRICRQLALGYTAEKLTELYALSRESQHPLGMMILIRALKVADTEKRDEYLQQAIKEGWSLTEVETKLFGRFDRREKVGRKLKLPEQPEELMAELEGWCMKWQRLGTQLERKGPDPHLRLSDLTPTVQKRLKDAIAAIGRLEQAVGKYLKKARAHATT
jgi:hypothetical protein